jgi:hypothetical protein
MSRTPLALLIGLAGLLLYFGLVLRLGDWVQTLHWTVQVVFYVLAGFLWVFPTRSLILWAVRGRQH